MRLTEREVDKLLLSVAAMVARDRRQRGLRLNCVLLTLLVATWITRSPLGRLMIAVRDDEDRVLDLRQLNEALAV